MQEGYLEISESNAPIVDPFPGNGANCLRCVVVASNTHKQECQLEEQTYKSLVVA